jgi:hypothetical protein
MVRRDQGNRADLLFLSSHMFAVHASGDSSTGST